MRILVIDDDDWKKAIYNNLCDDLDDEKNHLTFFGEASVKKINKEILDGFDIILLDLVLSKWDIDCRFVAEKIRRFSNSIPIVLITANWGAASFMYISKLTAEFKVENQPLNFIDLATKSQLEEIKRNEDQAKVIKISDGTSYADVANRLSLILGKSNRNNRLNKGEDDPIHILHISDLQLGGNVVKQSIQEPRLIKQKFKSTFGCDPDFIVVSGDVSESGLPEEYEQAKEWLKKLCEGFKWSSPYGRLLMVPGNHDVFLPLFSTQHTKFVTRRQAKESGFEEGLNFDRGQVNYPWIDELVTASFKEFAKDLTGNDYWITDKNLCWTDKRFTDLGVLFFGINSVSSVDVKCMYKGFPKAKVYEKMYSEIKDLEDVEGLFSVSIAHHPDLIDDENYRSFSCSYPGPNLFLSGHMHKQETYHKNGQICTTATTASLQSKDRWEDVSRGFSAITLRRSKDRVTDVETVHFIRTASNWIPDDTEKKSFSVSRDEKGTKLFEQPYKGSA